VYGVYAKATGACSTNYAVYGDGNGNSQPGTWAGYFPGDVNISGGTFHISDSNLKSNITAIKNSAAILKQLKPVSYTYNQQYAHSMDFDTVHHFGFIAQQVARVLPNLVTNTIKPARIDSAGNVTDSAVHCKAINYDGFI